MKDDDEIDSVYPSPRLFVDAIFIRAEPAVD
jgi:hypothetical protein